MDTSNQAKKIPAGGQPAHLISLHDITERVQAEAALAQLNTELEGRVAERTAELEASIHALQQARVEAEAANRAKSEFLSRVSHELRTPLNAILGFGQLLDMSVKESLTPTQRERVQRILEGGQHLLELVNEVLDISRIETGRLHVTLRCVDVHTVIEETLPLVEALSDQHEVQVQYQDGAVECAWVSADPLRLRQVLLNLLSNAIKFNQPGGAVSVQCSVVREQLSAGREGPAEDWPRMTDHRVRITVADTGPGIPAEKMARLFQPFDRLDAEQMGVEGTGLGLALSKRLVEAMGGKIGVESIVGEGSIFWIELKPDRS